METVAHQLTSAKHDDITSTRQLTPADGERCGAGRPDPSPASTSTPALVDGQSPPTGNTGGKVTPVKTGLGLSLDWLNFTFPAEQLGQVVRILDGWLGASELRNKGVQTYQHSRAWELGAIAGWSDERAEAWASLNGDSIAMLSDAAKLQLLKDLEALGVQCTRIDLTADDFTRELFPMEKVHQAAEAGNVIGFKRYDPRRPVRNVVTRELEGDTAYFGRRGSDGSGRYVRFYDKALESHGQVNSIRFECEFSGVRASMVFEVLASSFTLESMQEKIGRILGDVIDFRERHQHAHIDRMERLTWWARAVELLGQARLVTRRVVPPLQSAVEHFKRCWTRTLAKFCQIVEGDGHDGESIILDMIRGARGKAASWRPGARDVGIDLMSLLGLHEPTAAGVGLSDLAAVDLDSLPF